MFNANQPSHEDLPSSAQLLKSTLIALAAAAVLLVTVVLPAEYAIDPTGIGTRLGLTRMGEIKSQLADEADEADTDAEADLAMPQIAEEKVEAPDESITPPSSAADGWRDTTNLTLAPDESIEVKLIMKQGDTASFEWIAEGGSLNYNQHGDGGGQKIEYSKGRMTPSMSGELTAAFDGYHGWFWRNRSGASVALTLRTKGSYASIRSF